MLRDTILRRWGVWFRSDILLALCVFIAVSGYTALARFDVSFFYDVLWRYAPMAEEFAAGNFREAFHPKYGVLFQVLSGSLVWLTGLSGLFACQIVAILGFCLSAIPIWFFVRQLFSEEVAWWAVAILLIVPEYSDFAIVGLRDTWRILAFALMALGFVSRSIWFALGVFLCVTIRADGIFMGAVFCLGFCVHRFVTRRFKDVAFAASACAAGLIADSAMVWSLTGWFLPSSHYIKLF